MSNRKNFSRQELLDIDLDAIAERAEKSRKRKIKITIIIAVLVVAAIAAAVGIHYYIQWDSEMLPIYQNAVSAQNTGDYKTAIPLFKQLENYKDSKAQLEEIYQKAIAAQSSGDYTTAVSIFEQLGDYKDSETQLEAILSSDEYAEYLTNTYFKLNVYSSIEDWLLKDSSYKDTDVYPSKNIYFNNENNFVVISITISERYLYDERRMDREYNNIDYVAGYWRDKISGAGCDQVHITITLEDPNGEVLHTATA